MTAIHATLEESPPELAADITTEGVLLAGGGSLLRGLIERVGAETGMPVRLADDPLTCVARRRRHVARGARHAPARPPQLHALSADLYTPGDRDRWPRG